MTMLDHDALRAELEPEWNELREQRALREIRGRIDTRAEQPPATRSRRWKAVAVAAAAAVLVAAASWALWQGHSEGQHLRVAEGVNATVDDAAELSVVGVRSNRITIEQRGGEALYEVTPEVSREVVVWASGVRIRVVGTVFVVRDGSPVRVTVRRGAVEVESDGGVERLAAGRSSDFDPVSSAEQEQRVVTGTGNAPSAQRAKALGGQQHLSEPTDDSEALAPTATPDAAPAGGAPPSGQSDAAAPPTFDSLIAAADTARRAANLGRAAHLYARALRMPTTPGRRAATLFTLAVVEEQRGNHISAARRFRAYRLQTGGALAEEALAAEARNWRRGGNTTQAQAARSLYGTQFPAGRYADAL